MLDFDLDAALAEVQSFRTAQRICESDLAQGKKHNEQRGKLAHKLQRASELRNQMVVYVRALNDLHSKSINESVAFKNRRMESLEKSIEEKIHYVFPYERFTAKLETQHKHGNFKAYLRLIDKHGNVRLPHISEGKMMQTTISLASSTAAVVAFNSDKLYLDEFSAASSRENLGKVSDLLLEFINDGMQIIKIDQRPEGYSELPRREIHWQKDPNTERVVVLGTYDY